MRTLPDVDSIPASSDATTGFATSPDGVRVYYEHVGDGEPILFMHEFAGSHRSWGPQVAALRPRYRCIVYAARGYPPSDVPEDARSYSQGLAVSDAIAVLDAVAGEAAHLIGLSMGGFCALHLAIRDPRRIRSLVVASCGYGAHPSARETFRSECDAIAATIEASGTEGFARAYAASPARIRLRDKDADAYDAFVRTLSGLSSRGLASTIRGIQRERPSLFDLRDDLRSIEAPTLLIVGDEDRGCIEATLMLKDTLRSAGVLMLPNTGHTVNLEEPAAFNASVARFLAESVDR